MPSRRDEELLQRSVELARVHSLAGEGGPFGAVIARDGVIVAEGWNRVLETLDPTAHAEVVAIRRAAEALGRRSLDGCVLYSSCEPCPMCLGAAHWARLDAIHFGATREDAAAIGFDDAMLYAEVVRAPASRSVPCVAHAGEQARDAMRAWAAMSGHETY